MSKGGKTEGFAGPPAWVWRTRPAIGVGPWQVLMFMWSYVSFDEISGLYGPPSKPVYPSRDELADQIGCNPDNITTLWRQLKRLGLITKVGTRGAGVIAWRLEWRPDIAERPDGNHGSTETTGRQKPRVRPAKNHGSDSAKTTTPPVENHWPDPRKTTDGTLQEHHQGSLQPTHQENERARDLSGMFFVTQEHIAAVKASGDNWEYQRTCGSPRWSEAMGECINLFGLSPAQIAEALRKWDEGFETSRRPPRDQIWFWNSRDWLKAALGIETPTQERRRAGGFSPALSSAEAHHQRAVEAGEARRASEPKRDPAEIAREAARYAAIFEGAEDML